MTGFAHTQNPMEPQPSRATALSIADFSGGLNETWRGPTNPNKPAFSTLDNWCLDKTGLLSCRPVLTPAPFLYNSAQTVATLGGEAITCLYAGALGERVPTAIAISGDATSDPVAIAWRGGAGLFYPTQATLNEFETISKDSNPELTVFSSNNFSDIILCTDTDVPQRITDNGLVEMGLDAPDGDALASVTLAPAEVNPAGAADAITEYGIKHSGKFYYKMAYRYNESGTTKYGISPVTSSSVSEDIALGNTGRPWQMTIALSAGFFEGRADVESVLFYRSPPNTIEGPYLQVGEIFKGQSLTLVDSLPYGAEGMAADTSDTSPPILLHPVSAGGRLWGFDADIPTKLVWSNYGQPDVLHPLNFAYLPEDGTALGEWNGHVYVFSRRRTWRIDLADPAGLSEVAPVGCVSFPTVVNVGTGLCWMSEVNIHWANFVQYDRDGDFVVNIGDNLSETIKTLDELKYRFCRAGLYDGRYHLSLPDYTTLHPTQTYCWDIFASSWSRWDFGIYALARFGTTALLCKQDTLTISTEDYETYNCYYLNELSAQDALLTDLDGSYALTAEVSPVTATLKTRAILPATPVSQAVIQAVALVMETGSESVTVTVTPDSDSTKAKSITFTPDGFGEAVASGILSMRWSDEDGTVQDDERWTNSDPDLGKTYWDWSLDDIYRTQTFNGARRLPGQCKGVRFEIQVTVSDAGLSELHYIDLTLLPRPKRREL